MFKLNYVCTNCGASITCQTVDGHPTPPPDDCIKCLSSSAVNAKCKKNQPGDVFLGLRLNRYDKATRKWLVECLFCLETTVIAVSNLGRQKSCGCIKNGPMVIGDFLEPSDRDGEYVPRQVFCTCSVCSFGWNYSLETGQKIICKGCN